MVDKVQEITKPYTRFDGYMDMKKNNLKRQLDRSKTIWNAITA